MKLTNPSSLLAICTLTAAFISFFIAKSIYQPDRDAIIIDGTAPLPLVPITKVVAHNMSVAYRTQEGLCPDDPNCPITKKFGLFELTEATANDIVREIAQIKRDVQGSANPAPVSYRAVFGIDNNNNNRMMLAGLDGNNNEYSQFIKLIYGNVPCPRNCDIAVSGIIMGTKAGENECVALP